jgi:hypothetical protein
MRKKRKKKRRNSVTGSESGARGECVGLADILRRFLLASLRFWT